MKPWNCCARRGAIVGRFFPTGYQLVCSPWHGRQEHIAVIQIDHAEGLRLIDRKIRVTLPT